MTGVVVAQTSDGGAWKITLTVAGRPGDDVVASAGLVARHLPRLLGAGATMTTDARTTATPIDLVNVFFANAPKDGAAILLAPTNIAFSQALGAQGVTYDAGKLGWIGSLSHAPYTLATSWVTGFKSLEDGRRREMDLGAIGETGAAAWYPAILNAMLRTRFRVATIFRSDKEIDAAIENGEIGGRIASWSALSFARPPLLAQNKLNFLVQIGQSKIEAFGAAPLLTDIVTAPADRAVATFISADAGHGRALALPPGAPAEVVARYRKAFEAMVADPAFIEDARNARIEVSAVNGEATEKAVAAELATPLDAVKRAQAAMKAASP